jgi:nucleoid-associated protein YgaU
MAEVDGYWLRVVRANPQLGDPDLLFPGDVIVLPPVPGR